MDLGSLAPYVKPMVPNRGLKLDGDVKLDEQINHVVNSSFYQLRQLAKVRPVLLRQVIRAFITMHLKYCSALYVELRQASRSCLQLAS